MKRAILLSMVLFAAFGFSGCSYNDLTAKNENVKGQWSKVESTLQRRADLIPNMVQAAQMVGVQEQEVFGQISEARSRLINAASAAPAASNGDKTPEQKQAVIDANTSFGGTIGRLLSLQETYPVLRSSDLFLKVQDELSGSENRINTARIDYTDAVRDYNTTRNSFPAVLTASLLGFKEQPYFEADAGARKAPSVGDPNSMRRPPAENPSGNTAGQQVSPANRPAIADNRAGAMAPDGDTTPPPTPKK